MSTKKMNDIRAFFKPKTKPETAATSTEQGQENCQSHNQPVALVQDSQDTSKQGIKVKVGKKRSRTSSTANLGQAEKKAKGETTVKDTLVQSGGDVNVDTVVKSDENDNKNSDNVVNCDTDPDASEEIMEPSDSRRARVDIVSDLNSFLEASFSEEEEQGGADTTLDTEELNPEKASAAELGDDSVPADEEKESGGVPADEQKESGDSDKEKSEEESKSADEEYEVEHVLDYQVDKVTMQGMFRVHWKGWSTDDDTWEVIENLVGCQEELKEFYVKRWEEREKATPVQKRSLQLPKLPSLSSVLSKEEMDSLKKKTSKKDEEEKTPDPEFEAENIVDYLLDKVTMKGLYRVHWKGWSDDDDTWETMENLTDCKEMLKEFYIKRLKERENATPSQKRYLEVPPDPRTSWERTSEFADKLCPPPAQWVAEQFLKEKHSKWPESKLKKRLEWLCKRKSPKETELDELKQQLMHRHVDSLRKDQQSRLKEWQDEVNQLDTVKIRVENDYDLEGPPRYLKYIDKYYPSEGIIIPDDPIIGCECTTCEVKGEKNCCPGANGHMMAYNKFGRLRIDVGAPIYECNKKCACAAACYNRVVQKGRKTKLCVYRTPNGCGWGVKTLENIKRGSFVVEYVGEVITNDEAEERGKKYDAEGRTYLFDLDYNLGIDENKYTVDAAFYGNVSHFINHSCDPNLAIFNVWIDCLDPDLPRLCMFAVRDIVKGEQITFDYRQRTGANDGIDSDPLPTKENPSETNQDGSSGETSGEKTEEVQEENSMTKMECRCGTANCRKVLFC